MIAVGTMTWGREADPFESRQMYVCARDHGVTHFDTAALYSDGQAERLLGTFIRDYNDADKVTVSTKGCYRGENPQEELEGSLRRLGMDSVDLWFHHHWMKHGSLRVVDEMARLHGNGALRLGLSNTSAWAAALASALAPPIEALQVHYNLVARTAEVELMPLARAVEWEVYGYSPLAAGFLTGKYDTPGNRRIPRRLVQDKRYRRRYHDLNLVGRPVGPAVAVRWVERQGVVPIVGARNVQQLRESLAVVEYDDRQWATVESFFPRPPHPLDRPEEQP